MDKPLTYYMYITKHCFSCLYSLLLLSSDVGILCLHVCTYMYASVCLCVCLCIHILLYVNQVSVFFLQKHWLFLLVVLFAYPKGWPAEQVWNWEVSHFQRARQQLGRLSFLHFIPCDVCSFLSYWATLSKNMSCSIFVSIFSLYLSTLSLAVY